MFRTFILKQLFLLQKIILHISWYIFFYVKEEKSGTWVVGVTEIASMLHNIASSLSFSTSVRVNKALFYNFNYDIDWSQNSVLGLIKRHILIPILLAYLARKNNGFIYIGSEGFLYSKDARRFEFNFLKSKNKKIVCMFMGSDIRSFNLLEQFSKEKGIDTITTYQKFVNHGIDSLERENFRKELGRTADKYANAILNASVDQMAYIKRKTKPCLYFYPDNHFNININKWNNPLKLKVFHAPTSAIIKGTQLVRAAVKKLQIEGYDFEYVEMSGVAHSEILNTLKTTHIVLNQFYAFVPGVFGIEAMANGCVMLTSADPEIENTLPTGAADAWIVTPYWQVYDNLKKALDTPVELLAQKAEMGYNWSLEHYSYTSSGKQLTKIINEC